MAALTEFAEYLAKLAGEQGGKFLDKVGATMLEGASVPGAYTQGRKFAKTPEALATQFGLAPPVEQYGGIQFPSVHSPLEYGHVEPVSYSTLARKDWEDPQGMEYPGIKAFFDAQVPETVKPHQAYTDTLRRGSGEGKKMYPALFGYVVNNPEAHMITDTLTGSNVYRRNYALASAIGREPEAGSRLWASPEQFTQLKDVNVDALRRATPERQLGTLHTEAALQTMQRLFNAAQAEKNPVRRGLLMDLPGQVSSTTSPYNLQSAARLIQQSPLTSVGPGALRKLGIVGDLAQGRPVDLTAFKGLDYCDGGAVRRALL